MTIQGALSARGAALTQADTSDDGDTSDERTVAGVLSSAQSYGAVYGEAATHWRQLVADEKRRSRQACAQCQLFLENLEDCKPNDKLSHTQQQTNKTRWKVQTAEFFLHRNDPEHDKGSLLVDADDNVILGEMFKTLQQAGSPPSSPATVPPTEEPEVGDGVSDDESKSDKSAEFKHGGGTEATEAKLKQMILEADTLGEEVPSYELPYPNAGRPSLGKVPLATYCNKRPTHVKKNDLVLCKVDSLSAEPVNVCKVVKLMRLRGDFFVRLHYYGDGSNGFLGKYQPLRTLVNGRATGAPIEETYPLSIDGYSILLIDWGFSLRKNPAHTLPQDVVTLLTTDIRSFLQSEAHKQAAQLYIQPNAAKTKRKARP